MSNNKRPHKRQYLVAILVGTVVLVTVGLFIAWAQYVNVLEYLQMRQKCGTSELITGRTSPKDPQPKYKRPTDPNYRVPAAFSHYFCTEQDAIDAGYTPLYDDEGYYNN